MKKLLNILTIFIIFALVFATVSFANTGTLKDTDFLNVRESPSTSSNVVTVLPANASFDIIAEEGDWYQIKYQDYEGYVSKQYVEVSQTTANTSIPAKANSNGIVNTNSSLYVLPLLNSTVLGTVNSGTEVLVVSITGKWAYIQTDKTSGWVFTNNVNGTEETASETNNNDTSSENGNSDVVDNNEADTNSSDNQNNNAGSDENTNNSSSNENSGNEENANNTDNEENNNSNNEENNSDSNSSANSEDYPKTMYVNVDAVYIRAQATTSSDIVASVGLNTPVTVRGEEGDWYRVSVTDGDGYMMKQYLSDSRQ